MPGMTGMELAQHLREIQPDVQVILASGYAELPQSQSAVLDLPRLSKPFLQHDLARMISQYAQYAKLASVKEKAIPMRV
jgi:YesN/AraC family two-component response regulator